MTTTFRNPITLLYLAVLAYFAVLALAVTNTAPIVNQVADGLDYPLTCLGAYSAREISGYFYPERELLRHLLYYSDIFKVFTLPLLFGLMLLTAFGIGYKGEIRQHLLGLRGGLVLAGGAVFLLILNLLPMLDLIGCALE
jgi:hypothetical protein